MRAAVCTAIQSSMRRAMHARWPDVGEARPLGHAPDHLADLAASRATAGRVGQTPERVGGGALGRREAGEGPDRAIHPVPSRSATGQRQRRCRRSNPLCRRSPYGCSSAAPAPRACSSTSAPPASHRLPARGVTVSQELPLIAAPYRTITWRIATPSCSRSKPSFTSSRRNVPDIRRSTGNLPRRYSSM
jgi:hypothetical protein